MNILSILSLMAAGVLCIHAPVDPSTPPQGSSSMECHLRHSTQGDMTIQISAAECKVDPILDNADPAFLVRGLHVYIPALRRANSNRECRIDYVVDSVRWSVGADTSMRLIVDSVYRPQQVPEKFLRSRYPDVPSDSLPYVVHGAVRLRVANAKLPLPKERVRGSARLRITATYVDEEGFTSVEVKFTRFQFTN